MEKMFLVAALAAIMVCMSIITCSAEDVLTAEEINKLMIDSAKDTQTYKFTVNANISMGAANLKIPNVTSANQSSLLYQLSCQGAMNITGKAMAVTINATAAILNASQMANKANESSPQSAEIIALNDTLYLRQGDAWSKLPISSPDELWSGKKIVERQADLVNHTHIVMVGSDEIEGDNCYRLKVVPDNKSSAMLLARQISPFLGDSFASMNVTNLFRNISNNTKVNWTTWISKDSHLQRKGSIQAKIDLTPFNLSTLQQASGNATLYITIDITDLRKDYNTRIEILLPEAARNATGLSIGAIGPSGGLNYSQPSSKGAGPALDLAGDWIMQGKQTGVENSDWKAVLTLKADGTLSWLQTEGANIGTTRTGTWEFDGTTITMKWSSPKGGQITWTSNSVTSDGISQGTYTAELVSGGTWSALRSATKVYESEPKKSLQAPNLGQQTATEWLNEGQRLVDQGKYYEALQAYDEGIKLDPRWTDLYYHKGTAFTKLNMVDRAVEAFDMVNQINPKDGVVAYYWMGRTLSGAGRYDEAIQAYGRSTQSFNTYDEWYPGQKSICAQAWFHEGLGLDAVGRSDEAQDAYDNAIKLDPSITWPNKAGCDTKVNNPCPWTPEGYTVEPCCPGYCWDGGLQGSLACKQEELVPNSIRTSKSDLVCDNGYAAVRDPSTGLIKECKSLVHENGQTIDASPGGTDLAGSYPTRGFGDSDQVDVWVPFSFDFSVPTSVDKAKIVMVVKPIGQLIGTDQLVLKGVSGQGQVVYDKFSDLPTNQWNTVEVDVSGNSDVMGAIRKGHLEGMIQDDTAVQSVKLII